MGKMIQIKIDKYTSPQATALVGRANGEKFLVTVENDLGNILEMGRNYENVEIIIPKRIITMNKSFFLGMFENTIKAYGKNEFLKIYIFTASEYIKSKLSNYCDYALLTSSAEDILKNA